MTTTFLLKIEKKALVSQEIAMQDFFQNVSRYPRYLISFSLGIFFALFQRIKPLFNRPVTATALIGIIISGFFLLVFTLRGMLGYTTL